MILVTVFFELRQSPIYESRSAFLPLSGIMIMMMIMDVVGTRNHKYIFGAYSCRHVGNMQPFIVRI